MASDLQEIAGTSDIDDNTKVLKCKEPKGSNGRSNRDGNDDGDSPIHTEAQLMVSP
jgi:hypothetical protein